MNRANADIRNAVATNGFKLWELAAALGINDGNLSRKLRTELPASERLTIKSQAPKQNFREKF